MFKFTNDVGLPIVHKFEWVNKDQSDDEDENKKRDVSKELFMSADRTMITVGGGKVALHNVHYSLRFPTDPTLM